MEPWILVLGIVVLFVGVVFYFTRSSEDSNGGSGVFKPPVIPGHSAENEGDVKNGEEFFAVAMGRPGHGGTVESELKLDAGGNVWSKSRTPNRFREDVVGTWILDNPVGEYSFELLGITGSEYAVHGPENGYMSSSPSWQMEMLSPSGSTKAEMYIKIKPKKEGKRCGILKLILSAEIPQ